ncbi:hypothetical protein [Flavobacterium sp. 3HN19-14]|uniref:hypothetical protein n=1 Tax=Flavobacterium sp. 3HN19-14 TaxID=3448133 RepID=UPI003EDFFEDD
MSNICNLLAVQTEVDCSYSNASVEQVYIPNATTGEYYVLLVDNFDNLPGNISIQQIGGSGSSDCGFLSSVAITDAAGNDITQFDYCNPATKDLIATVDTSDFDGNPIDLRFNYKWYKDDVLIVDLPAQVQSTNQITVSESGVYRIELTAYDSTDPDVVQSELPVSTDDVTLTIYNTPSFTVAMPASQCLNDNPVLQVTDTSTPPQTYSYQWYRNNTAIPGRQTFSLTRHSPAITRSGFQIPDARRLTLLSSPSTRNLRRRF